MEIMTFRPGRRTHGRAWTCLGFLLTLALLSEKTAAQDLMSRPITFADGRVAIGTEISLSATPQDDDGAWFNYTDYEHNALRLFRAGVTADLRIADRLSFLTEVRSENGQSPIPYALYVRIRPWKDRPFDIQAGRIPPTFGAFSRRNYGSGNPVIGYPLAYQYLTSLRTDAIPADTEELLRMRARGWRPNYVIGSQTVTTGIPLITAFRWDTGVQFRIGPDQLMASIAVTNGTVSDPHTKDINGGKQISGRMQWRPTPGLLLGASGAQGPYLTDYLEDYTGSVATQRAFGFDGEYSRDHWLLRGEFIWDQWDMPTVSQPLNAVSAFGEGSYKILPGLYVAARIDRLGYNTMNSVRVPREWDAPVTRIEGGGGFYVRRNLLLKATYQYNWRDGGLVRRLGFFAGQVHFWL